MPQDNSFASYFGLFSASFGGASGGVFSAVEGRYLGSALPDDNVVGVYGVASPPTGANSAGVRGSAGSGSTGVRGTGGNGGWFSSVDLNGTGVLGSVTGNGHGVRGEAGGANGFGVIGTAPNGIGVVGTGGSVGIVGYQPSGYAGLFVGNLAVTGTLTKGAGAFRIDHPLDPAHEYLQHSFVESPDMKNVYDGIVTTDGRGFATVRLPRYFQALNRSFRYQLTIVGKAPWGTESRVWNEIALNRFTIRTNKPRVRVSWQVTGIRKDRYANAHRIQPELAKPESEQGTYLSPELYGKPRSQASFRLPNGNG